MSVLSVKRFALALLSLSTLVAFYKNVPDAQRHDFRKMYLHISVVMGFLCLSPLAPIYQRRNVTSV